MVKSGGAAIVVGLSHFSSMARSASVKGTYTQQQMDKSRRHVGHLYHQDDAQGERKTEPIETLRARPYLWCG